MSTYRADGVTIVREGQQAAPGHWHEGHPCPECPRDPELVAVVVNGDQALAERICALLNSRNGTPDRDYQRGANDALAEVRRRLECGGVLYPADAQMLHDAAAELGVTEPAYGLTEEAE